MTEMGVSTDGAEVSVSARSGEVLDAAALRAVYEIEVENPEGVSRGVKELLVDGERLKGDLIRPYSDGRVHRVRVVMG